jgi:hypothetical protein
LPVAALKSVSVLVRTGICDVFLFENSKLFNVKYVWV